MTPQQKLIAIKDMLSVPGTMVTPDLAVMLADVHLPPRELHGLNDPEAWAKALSQTVAGVSHETALAWLLPAMEAADAYGYRQGMHEGARQASSANLEGRTALVDALKLVVSLIERRQIRGVTVRDANDPDNPPRPLLAYLVDTLRSVGENVE
jgi:hypothetical protein